MSVGAAFELDVSFADLRRIAGFDTYAARALAAYLAVRAVRLPKARRARVLAETARHAAGRDEEVADAQRYAALRSSLVDLDEQLSDPAPERAVDDSRRAHDLDGMSYALMLVASALIVSFVIWNRSASAPLIGAAALVAGFVGAALGVAARSARSRIAMAPVRHVSAMIAHEQAQRDARTARAALLESDDARWLREVVARHPTLAFGPFPASTAGYRGALPQ